MGRVAPPAPVEADTDGSLRDAAVAEHAENFWPAAFGQKAKYRNWSTERPDGSVWSWDVASSIHGAEAIRAARVPVYHLLGWYDLYTTQQAVLFANLGGTPQRMMIGPWLHDGGFGSDVHRAEVLRWFDHWLKGIDNGITDEPPIHYSVMLGNNTVPERAGQRLSDDELAARDPETWIAAETWPPRARGKKLYLAAGPSGTVASLNDGRLDKKRPKAETGQDDYLVDYTSSMGSFGRWENGYGEERSLAPVGTTFFDERTAEDEKALTYTSAPQRRDLVIVGYPVVHLWASSTAKDGDFFAYLEEIDAEGRAHYVTEGAIRASYRALAEAPWEQFGLPFHRSWKKDKIRLRGEPVELIFDLMGTAIVIDRGHRIRLTIAGADERNHALYPDRKGRKRPTVSVYRSREYRSWVELPTVR